MSLIDPRPTIEIGGSQFCKKKKKTIERDFNTIVAVILRRLKIQSGSQSQTTGRALKSSAARMCQVENRN